MGRTAEQIHQPVAGVASSWNRVAPCHSALMREAQAIVTRTVLQNAAAVLAVSGRPVVSGRRAMQRSSGIACDPSDVAEVFKRTPYIADLKPAGRFVAKDLFDATGVPLLMKTLLETVSCMATA
jgi:dihydroxyacid dehydratase/phosphogluconate dehydratase